MLHDIEDLLKEKGPLTAPMIARQLKSSEQAVDGMLSLLLARGKISKTSQSACEGSCCHTGENLELYQWQGGNALPVSNMT